MFLCVVVANGGFFLRLAFSLVSSSIWDALVALSVVMGRPTPMKLASFSGRIENCFGVHATREGYSPERSLRYRVGEGNRTVRIRTMSSRIEICAESLSG